MFPCFSELRLLPCVIVAGFLCSIGSGNIWVIPCAYKASRTGLVIHVKDFYGNVLKFFGSVPSTCYNLMYLTAVDGCLLTFDRWYCLLEFFCFDITLSFEPNYLLPSAEVEFLTR